jgi:uncharacterized repeat protein (TIGR01451 family)
VTDPDGQVTVANLTGGAAGWSYQLNPPRGGVVLLAPHASDPAGNIASLDPFTVIVLAPLQIEQLVTPEFDVQAGSLVTYTLTVVNNNAGETAQNVVITGTLSPSLTPVSTGGASFANHQFTWPAVTLAGASYLTRTVVARLTSQLLITPTLPLTIVVDLHGANLTSAAGLTTSNLGPTQANLTSLVVEGAPVPLHQSVMHSSLQVIPATPATPGAVLTYVIRLTNTTDVTATNVVVSDTFSLALSPVNLGGGPTPPPRVP